MSSNASAANLSVDLTGSLEFGRVDPVSNLVGAQGGTLWPVLITLDLFAILGIALVMRRWKRETDET